MRRRRRPDAPGREWAVLVIAFAAAGLLLWASASPLGDPETLGAAVLSRVAGEVADGVVAEWERGLAHDDWPWPAVALPADPPEPAPRPRTLVATVDEPLVDAVIEEAHGCRYDDPDEALALAVHALERTEDLARRARARRLAIQLAADAGREDLVREHWRAAATALDGAAAWDDTSAWLLCALAAAPALPEEERAELVTSLLDAWRAGTLALPERDDRLAALERRLLELAAEVGASDAASAAIAVASARRTARALGPVDVWPRPRDTRWTVAADERVVVVARRSPDLADDLVEGFAVARTEFADGLVRRLREARALPDGFVLDVAGDRHEIPAVRPRTPLAGDALGFVLRHQDPDALTVDERARGSLLRAASIGTAALLAVAGVSTALALRRQRRLGELRTAFVASVSHELRTPVASILLLADNLAAGRSSDPRRDHAAIAEQAQRLRRLVDDVLDFSRWERGQRWSPVLDEVDAHALVEECVADASRACERAGVALHVERGALPLTVVADTDAVRRAVLNLVDNAIRHARSPRLDLAFDTSADGADWRVRVRDHGAGLSERARARATRPFVRFDESTPGTGLGLAIVDRVARSHGGRLRLEQPETGPGLAAVIEWPCEVDASAALGIEVAR